MMATQIEQHIMKTETFHQHQWKHSFPENRPQNNMATRNYTIVPLTKADSTRAMAFLRKFFFRDEPLNVTVKLLGENGQDTCPELDGYCLKSLEEPYSLAAVSPTGELIGVCLNGTHEPGHMDEIDANADACPNPKFKKILKLLATVEKRADIFGRFPDIDKIMEVRVLSVDGAYRGQGIATALINRTRELAQELGLPMVRVDCTSHYTACAVARLGFQTIFKLPYSEHLGEDGKPVLAPASPHRQVLSCVFRT